MDSVELAKLVRRDCVEMVHNSHASHIGSALSVVDILSVLYTKFLNITPQSYSNDNRDILILSKGHAGIAVYAILAELGFFDKRKLKTYYQNGSVLSGHVSHKGVPGIEFSTGSLGHGLAVGCGYALGAKLNKIKKKVFVICGDGELDEGSNWEAIANASKLKLNNLILIIDKNNMQAMGWCKDILDLSDISTKLCDFNWDCFTIKDGNDHKLLSEAFTKITNQEKPLCFVANTVKGKGVSFMENNLLWHYRDPQGEYYNQAMKEL